MLKIISDHIKHLLYLDKYFEQSNTSSSLILNVEFAKKEIE